MKERCQDNIVKRENKSLYRNMLLVGKWVFFLLMLAQIVPGICWLIENIDQRALFHETENYLRGAEHLVVDEYMGILYPLLIRLAMEAERIGGIPYFVWIYFLQLGAAFGSTMYFWRRVKLIGKRCRMDTFRRMFLTVYVITFPMLLQMHLAVLPVSLTLSAGILLVAEGIHIMGDISGLNGRKVMLLCGLWMIGFLLMPDYGWFFGIFTAGVFVKVMLADRKWLPRLIIALLSTILCFGILGDYTQTPGSMGRMEKTLGASMVHRFVWPYFVRDSFFWSREITDTFEYYDLVEFAQAPEAVTYKFGPVLEEKYGVKEANRIYLEMAGISLQCGSKQTLKNIAGDFLANLCPQAGLQVLLEHNETSLSSWNYARLQDQSPLLARYWLDVSMTGWNVMCLAGVILWIAGRKKRSSCGYVIPVSLLFVILWYTLSTGMQDYKNMAVLTFFWLLPVVKGVLTAEEIARPEERLTVEE